jgi:hypothetical protein
LPGDKSNNFDAQKPDLKCYPVVGMWVLVCAFFVLHGQIRKKKDVPVLEHPLNNSELKSGPIVVQKAYIQLHFRLQTQRYYNILSGICHFDSTPRKPAERCSDS